MFLYSEKLSVDKIKILRFHMDILLDLLLVEAICLLI